jgi:hypothetical protein
VIAALKPAGSNTRGLLAYLYGPGRQNEHVDPHAVAGFAMLGMPDPGRDENATLTELACYPDEPVRLRNGEFGLPVTDHVWHYPVRAPLTDRYPSDTEWGEISQRIVEAAGIASPGDDLACRPGCGCGHPRGVRRSTIREDSRRPKPHDSGIHVGDACREIEKDYGLRQLKKGDRGPFGSAVGFRHLSFSRYQTRGRVVSPPACGLPERDPPPGTPNSLDHILTSCRLLTPSRPYWRHAYCAQESQGSS